MFLKSLEIFGFKSFPNKTRIEFGEGVTALMGPNGCGKSNVVDAVKWVLGEQSAKTLRAGKMEDVIFNGTENRKPLNVAEVTLTISNESGFLDLDISEIAIKRRVYRSGESEYFINNQPVKLREIRELFWDTGVGKVAYSVMEQGKIDQVLSSKPEDRRYLFEEAAGITRFKVKGQEAERKLERTDENIKRISVVLDEVKRSYDSLKVQAEKTKKYQTLSDKIFEAELDVQLLKLRDANFRLNEKTADAENTKKKIAELNENLSSINNSVTENLDLVNEMQAELSEKQKNIFAIAAEQNTKKESCKIYERQQSELKMKISQLNERKRAVNEKIESLQTDIDEQQSSLRTLEKNVIEIEKNISEFEHTIEIALDKIRANNSSVAANEAKIKELEIKRNENELELHNITEDIVTELDKKLNQSGYSSKERADCETEVFNVLGKLKIVISGRKNLFNDAKNFDAANSELHEKIQTSFEEIETLVNSLNEKMQEYKKMSFSFIDEFLSPEGIITKKRTIDKLIRENKTQVENLRAAIAGLHSENAMLDKKIAEYNSTLTSLSVNKTKAVTQADACKQQMSIFKRELVSQENGLHEIENDIFLEEKNFEENEGIVLDLQGEINALEKQGQKLTEELKKLEDAITLRSSNLASKKDKITSLTENIGKQQAMLEKHLTAVDFIKDDIENIKNAFRENYSVDLMEHEERMFKIKENPQDLKNDSVRLKQELKNLGTVNHMAIEEFAEVKERYDFLNTQITDLQKARDDLKRITDEIRAESTEIFLDTYQKIKRNFHNMFRRLFGGGKAEIKLEDPKNVLESGIDIFAQPPGKRLESIGLLSGGERSMTAVALLFATYMVKPSPFCFLDEIDAALDEQNVIRFTTTLKEFASMSQYIVITHNKRTVLGSNTMLGVTMGESGVSTLVSIKLQGDEKQIDEQHRVEADLENFVEEDVPTEEGIYVPERPPKRTGSSASAESVPETEPTT